MLRLTLLSLFLFFSSGCGEKSNLSELTITPNKLIDLEFGGAENCVIADTGVYCWGDSSLFNENFQVRHISPLVPIGLAVSGSVSCMIVPDGARCWQTYIFDRRAAYPELEPPKLTNPVVISAGSDTFCVIEDRGVVCWGGNRTIINYVPELVNPFELSVGHDDACALDETGIVCWGLHDLNEDIPSVINPTSLVGNGTGFCVNSSSGVRCWGRSSDKLDSPKNISESAELSMGNQHACALSDSGVQCWGFIYKKDVKPPPLKKPYAIHADRGQACALDMQGIVCWGDSSNKRQVNISPVFQMLQDKGQ